MKTRITLPTPKPARDGRSPRDEKPQPAAAPAQGAFSMERWRKMYVSAVNPPQEEECDNEPSGGLARIFVVLLLAHVFLIGSIVLYNCIAERPRMAASDSNNKAPVKAKAGPEPAVQAVTNNAKPAPAAHDSKPSSPSSQKYKVAQGDTVAAIAQKLGVDQQALRLENHLDAGAEPHRDTELTIPAKSASAKPTPPKPPTPQPTPSPALASANSSNKTPPPAPAAPKTSPTPASAPAPITGKPAPPPLLAALPPPKAQDTKPNKPAPTPPPQVTAKTEPKHDPPHAAPTPPPSNAMLVVDQPPKAILVKAPPGPDDIDDSPPKAIAKAADPSTGSGGNAKPVDKPTKPQDPPPAPAKPKEVASNDTPPKDASPKESATKDITTAESKPKPAAKSADSGKSTGKYRYHVITSKDTLYGISKKYKVKVEELMRLNNISDPRKMRDGLKIKIPAPKNKDTA